MQSLPLQTKRTFCGTVNTVSEDRMPDTCHMYTDLMGTSGFQCTFNIGIISKSFQYTIVCHCSSAVWSMDAHFFSVCRVASDRSIDRSGILFEISVDDRMILSGDRVCLLIARQGNYVPGHFCRSKESRSYPYRFCERSPVGVHR